MLRVCVSFSTLFCSEYVKCKLPILIFVVAGYSRKQFCPVCGGAKVHLRGGCSALLQGLVKASAELGIDAKGRELLRRKIFLTVYLNFEQTKREKRKL